MEHASLSPSAGSRWLYCTSSPALIAQENPPNETSSFAHEGTVCHDIAEKILTKKIQENVTGQTFDGVLITDELWLAIATYCKRVTEISKQIAGTSVYEQKVVYSNDVWGTSDALHYNPSILYIQDLKMGKGVEVFADSEQGRIYACATRKNFNIDPMVIILEIIQPRMKSEPDIITMTKNELDVWERDVLNPAVRAINSGQGVFQEGEKICKWCPVSAVCPQKAGVAIKLASPTVKSLVVEEKPQLKNIQTMESGHLIEIYKKLPILESWIKSVKEHVKNKTTLNDPDFTEHFKIVSGRSNRKWVDEKIVENFVTQECKVPVEEIYNYKMKSPAQMEVVLQKYNLTYEAIKNHVTKPEGKPTVVLNDNPKPELEQDAGAIFRSNPVSGIKVPDNITGPVADNDMSVSGMTPVDTQSKQIDVIVEKIPEGEPEGGYNKHKFRRTDGYSHRNRGEVIKPIEGPKSERYKRIYDYSGKITMEDLAVQEGCKPETIKRAIAKINEKYGYETTINPDGTFIIGDQVSSVPVQTVIPDPDPVNPLPPPPPPVTGESNFLE